MLKINLQQSSFSHGIEWVALGYFVQGGRHDGDALKIDSNEPQ